VSFETITQVNVLDFRNSVLYLYWGCVNCSLIQGPEYSRRIILFLVMILVMAIVVVVVVP
jgi:hypothetical protein